MGVNFLFANILIVAINILINDCTPTELRGTANGIAGLSCDMGKMIGPSVYGSLYSWSLHNVQGVTTNRNPLGFPLDVYFVFLIVAVSGVIIAAVGRFALPRNVSTIEEEPTNC